MPTLTNNQDQEVSISQQGVLKEFHINATITSTGSINSDLTVPTGKTWLLKTIMWTKSSGTFTTKPTITLITSQTTPYTADGVYQIVGASGDTNQLLHLPSEIQMTAGDILRSNTNTTVWSASGEVRLRILAQELDA